VAPIEGRLKGAMDMNELSSLQLSEATKKAITASFIKELKRANPDFYDPESEAEIFIGCLEFIANNPYSKSDPQKKRREKIEAFANAVDRLIDAGLAADESSLGYAVWRGFTEAYSLSGCSESDRQVVARYEGMPSTSLIYDLQHRHKEMFSAFALGVRKAIGDLPSLDKEYSDEQKTAEWIEEYLGRHKIKFSTSDTGLAGQSFLATMDLMGKNIKRAGYWLKIAKNGDSWVKFIERMRTKQKNDAE
jgi:hypothetical protein